MAALNIGLVIYQYPLAYLLALQGRALLRPSAWLSGGRSRGATLPSA
jgi:hypothetical protein